jgi:diguanylate cyclase (GGDEF)-like protein
MISLPAYTDFKAASTEVLDYLHSQLGFRLWMVTRTESNDWIVLNAKDHGYNVESGDVFRWTDSFCSRMVQGLGPQIAPRSDNVPAYAAAPIGQQVPIGAYVGVPLTRSGGELFGTLCAIDPEPMPDEIVTKLSLIELMSRLLTTILENELKAHQEHRRAERARAEAMTDQLTGLYNRRGWDELLATEDHRCQRYGHPASVLSIDLDDLKTVNDEQGHAQGDALLCRAAAALKSVARESDIVARLGGDEFTVLAVECEIDGGQALLNRLERGLRDAGVSASIGMAMRNATGSLAETLEKADQRMYERKARRKASLLEPSVSSGDPLMPLTIRSSD